MTPLELGVSLLEASASIGIRFVDGWWAFFAAVWAWTFLASDVEVPRYMAGISAMASAIAVLAMWGLGMSSSSAIAGTCTLFSLLTLTAKHHLRLLRLVHADLSPPPSATSSSSSSSSRLFSSNPLLDGGPPPEAASGATSLIAVGKLTTCQTALLALVIVCQLLAALQAQGEFWSRTTGRSAPGEMVEIGRGRWLHMRCVGSGPRVVILESGLPFSSTVWQPLMDLFDKRLTESKQGGGGGGRELLSQVTLCAYDRAGYGWSPRARAIDGPDLNGSRRRRSRWGWWWLGCSSRTGKSMREDLEALIASRGFERPILMGWSYGGQLAASYACERPDQVSGLVLVESAAPYGYFNIPDFAEAWWAGVAAFAVGQILQPLGLFRILWRLGLFPVEAGGPPPGLSPLATSAIVSQMSSYEFPSVALLELIGMRQTDADVANCFGRPKTWIPTPLGDVPALVVYAEDNPQAPADLREREETKRKAGGFEEEGGRRRRGRRE
ncbi:hypothetical protein CBR_g31574 [Chara braunii]|uniref:AB hydrolase-1 domain-containing protein n=1 Tax=Chara braunii TaxID=69332 RepID=A0A388LFE1_CHABU|nr:hypothetical protein CBR_g31574 [Chara braunii]|eukprot:GBG81018.1 hypothetical protein CBR_g31574 [Chara braunii]